MTNTTAPVNPSEVGWQFVPQYYTFVNKHPGRLHCFYTKTSTFIHGTEGEEGKPCYGQAEIHAKITSIGFQDCKVFIHSVDAQSSANGGIIIQVIGEMSNHGEPWRKFVQTFFLAEQPNGYFVLNDIFRFLKEEAVEDDQASDSENPASQEVPVAVTMPIPEPSPAPQAPPMPTPAPALPVPEPEPEVVLPPSPPRAPSPELEEEPPVSEPEPEPETQVNGAHEPEPEPEVVVPPSPVEPIPEPVATASPPPVSPETPAVPLAPSPVPPAPQPQTQPPPPPQPQPAPVAAPAPAPPTPSVPPQPKTWANLAAANHNKWGAVAQEAKGISEVPVTSSSPAPPSGSQAPPQRPPPQRGEAWNVAMNVPIAACFVKGVTENISEPALRSTLTQRFGVIKELDIHRQKACAFLEFERIDSARKAIAASLHASHGGEGGIRIGASQDGGPVPRVFVETRKERNERPPPRGGAPNGGENRRGGGYRGGRGGGYGGRGGRGGGGGAGAGASTK